MNIDQRLALQDQQIRDQAKAIADLSVQVTRLTGENAVTTEFLVMLCASAQPLMRTTVIAAIQVAIEREREAGRILLASAIEAALHRLLGDIPPTP